MRMVIAPEQLAYWASIPISRLEEEVSQMVAAMHAAAVRDSTHQAQIVRPTGQMVMHDLPVLMQARSGIAEQPQQAGDSYGKLYYEDMPLQYNGRTIREAQEVLPIVDGRLDDDAYRL